MDPTAALIENLGQKPYVACGLLFGLGIISAFGPCGAQRALGLIACTTHRKGVSTIFFYTLGIITATTALLAGTMFVRNLVDAAHLTNVCMAVFCIGFGVAGLWNTENRACNNHAPLLELSATGTFGLGFGSSLLIAPCCTPFFFLIAAYSPAHLLNTYAIFYGVGSAFPYLLAGLSARTLIARIAHASLQQAVRIVSSSITLALGFIYLMETAP